MDVIVEVAILTYLARFCHTHEHGLVEVEEVGYLFDFVVLALYVVERN